MKFKASLQKFAEQGEKTGWTFVAIPAEIAEVWKPGVRTSYRVKGTIDNLAISQVAIIPIGKGVFILPVNAALRKTLGKRKGEQVILQLEADDSSFVMNADLLACLDDEPQARQFFDKLPGSHKRYFSKWIEAAKTTPTRAKRIAQAVTALSKENNFSEMLRAGKSN